MFSPLITLTLAEQDHIISRDQLLRLGAHLADVRRWVRRRALVRIVDGVYIDHSGPINWHQRAVAGCLLTGGALNGGSALRVWLNEPRWSPDSQPILIGIDQARRVNPPPGYQMRRLDHYAQRVARSAPPLVSLEECPQSLAAPSPQRC